MRLVRLTCLCSDAGAPVEVEYFPRPGYDGYCLQGRDHSSLTVPILQQAVRYRLQTNIYSAGLIQGKGFACHSV